MPASVPMVDIHCHLVPGIDDGAKDLETSIAMARMAENDGVATVIATPHQLGRFSLNRGEAIREAVHTLQAKLEAAGVELCVLAGADVRIEDGIAASLESGDVLTLGDRGRHVLLELPHDLYFSIDTLLEQLRRRGIIGILTHPERNAGLIRQRELIYGLVDSGCLMQVTAGSLLGAFGPHCQRFGEWMLREGLVHFVATDAHGVRSRRPLMARAFDRVAELTDRATAIDLCCEYPRLAAHGKTTPSGRRRRSSAFRRLLRRGKAA